MSKSDRRRLSRHNLIYYLEVFNTETGELAGRVVDLNQEGLMLISKSQPATGATYQLEMQLPREVMANQKLAFSAECRWSKVDVNPDFFVSGYKIDEMNQDGAPVIVSLAREFGFSGS